MAVYDFYKEENKNNTVKTFRKGIIAVGIILFIIIAVIVSTYFYLEIIQLDEIGDYSNVFLKNVLYKVIFSVLSFIIIFAVVFPTNTIIRRNIKRHFDQNGIVSKKLPNFSIAVIIAALGAFVSKDYFFQKALTFLNSNSFGKTDPIFNHDIGYYMFERPFLMSLYNFIFTLWFFVIVYTIAYYVLSFLVVFNSVTFEDLKIKTIIRHNLVNIAILFIIKTISFKFTKEEILFSNVVNVNGAGFIDVSIWLKYYNAAPYVLSVIVIAALFFIFKGKLRKAAYTIAIFPAIWIIVSLIAALVQVVYVKPNEYVLEKEYIKYNMEKTREAYGLDNISNYEFPYQELTPEIVKRNQETIDNIRVVDFQPTLESNRQLQSNTNFYSFYDGDIINYDINGKQTPVFITAREINKNNLPDKKYINTMFAYTHGYGVVINPINKTTSGGQVDFILSSLKLTSTSSNLKVTEPRIYYGELTNDQVIVNTQDDFIEVDYDGTETTKYSGDGGIKLGLLNRALFALKYSDFNMLISNYVSSDSRLLLNRNIIERAKKAVPFLTVDSDAYIILTDDGRLKWVIDAYTTSGNYPYSQNYVSTNINYIKNSVKIIVDAYDGSVKYYIIDKEDPVLKTYSKIYPGLFISEPLPEDVLKHMRYPETLFKIQTEILKKYHVDPNGTNQDNVSIFYKNNDLWNIAMYPDDGSGSKTKEIDPYYNMIELPGDVGQKQEMILMRPFTPSEGKDNMVSWLAVRNSSEDYGELILFHFKKNTNIFGPMQVERKINQIDEVSKDMTLWGQSGSNVYKGSLLVIPIEQSVLYVEPIYIQAVGQSSIPEVRTIVVGYQKGDEFKYGQGATLKDALNSLFEGALTQQTPTQPTQPTQPVKPAEPGTGSASENAVNEIINKYDELKKQLDELGKLINGLKK